MYMYIVYDRMYISTQTVTVTSVTLHIYKYACSVECIVAILKFIHLFFIPLVRNSHSSAHFCIFAISLTHYFITFNSKIFKRMSICGLLRFCDIKLNLLQFPILISAPAFIAIIFQFSYLCES